MRKATKIFISFAVVLIAGLNLIAPAFAQDPFSAIAVGGLTGASGAGLFGSMAAMSGIDIAWTGSASSDPMNALWDVTNPDHVYFSGEKHEATNIGEDIYDYIEVDIGDWLDAQSDFIVKLIQDNNIQDNDTGNISVPTTYRGLQVGDVSPTYQGIGEYLWANNIWLKCSNVGGSLPYRYELIVDQQAQCHYYTSTLQPFYAIYYQYVSGSYVKFRLVIGGNNSDGNFTLAQHPGIVTGFQAGYTAGTIDTGKFDNWESAKVKIPHSISQLQTGWTLPEFLSELDRIWAGAGEDNIIIEDGGDIPPVPPQPIPDTPLGEVPFDDWVDLWGQSIWEQLTRLEEKQELMVINQESGLDSLDDLQGLGEDLIEDVDDLIGLETDINENLEDVITYEQGISEDVEDIGEYVEDIDDQIIVIVDEMGNVIDVLEGIEAKIYAQGQTIGSISTEVGTIADVTEAISTEVEAQSEIQEDIKDAVEDMIPYVMPLPDIASDTETIVDTLPDIATATQTSTQTLTDTLPDIKDATETITETLPDIITEIQDATTTLTDEIPNIDDICLNIDEAPYKDLETGVDRLPRFLLPFITDLRSALGIWHYVTEWLAQISTTFAFISGCLVGTSIMTPIYAAIAGFMCIKIYRRMCG